MILQYTWAYLGIRTFTKEHLPYHFSRYLKARVRLGPSFLRCISSNVPYNVLLLETVNIAKQRVSQNQAQANRY
mgnify:CR=1 FL=1